MQILTDVSLSLSNRSPFLSSHLHTDLKFFLRLLISSLQTMNFSQSPRSSKRLALKMENCLSTDNNGKKPWSDLPRDLLESIANRLSIIELLAFRCVCKDWRLGSSTASAAQSKSESPWFLLYDNESKYHLYDSSLDNKYTFHIPEMDGTTCIASVDGWLLLYRGQSMFFFCPFSRAKIDLPEFPYSTLSGHFAVFSSPPTSQDCVVCVLNQRNKTKLELNLIRRGANNWAKHESPPYMPNLIKTITFAAFRNGIFYFFDYFHAVVTFAPGNETWTLQPRVFSSNRSFPILPYALDRVNLKRRINLKLGLEEDESLSTCGTVLPGSGLYTCIHNVNQGPTNAERCKKGVLLQPRFFELPANQSWSL